MKFTVKELSPVSCDLQFAFLLECDCEKAAATAAAASFHQNGGVL